MPFPSHLLTDDEELILDLRPHWWSLAPASLLLGVALLLGLADLVQDWWRPVDFAVGAFFLGALGWFVVVYLKWTTTNFVVTNERVISRRGVVAKKGIEIPLDRINTVFFNQSVFERLIRAGDLGIESAGEAGREEFSDIRRPSVVQNEIYRQAEGLEERRIQRMGDAVAGGRAASIPEQIEKLDELRNRGVISEDEFQAKKRDLLDRM